jgi:hypothetical protein
MRKIFCCALILGLAWGCESHRTPLPRAVTPAATPASASTSAAGPVQIEMKNVRLHLDDGIILNVRTLRGEMISKTDGPPVFDDRNSYVLRVFTGDVSMDMPSLTNLMNRYVFAYDGAPLRDISISVDAGKLKMKGQMNKGVWLPFSMHAVPGATADGRLLLDTKSVNALGIPATKLMDLLGLTLADLMTVEQRRGVEIKDDLVMISTGRVLPPPQMQAHLARTEIVDGALRELFSPADGRPVPTLTPPDPKSRNYFYFRGAIIRFGKLTMTGADLQLIDIDERDAFDFYTAKYNAQLVAGYSKNTPAKGLMTYMPDFDDLKPGLDVRPKARQR